MHFASDWKKRSVGDAAGGAVSPLVSSVVDKATSELLQSPDWGVNMDICDSINSTAWQAKDVVKAVTKRLQTKSTNVQLLSLTLLEAIVKNCGEHVHLQIAESDVLQELVKIVKKKTDVNVRDNILVLLESWQEAFGGHRGKYPHFYLAYADLKKSGFKFPPRSGGAAPIFTPPIARPIQHKHHASNARTAMRRKPSMRLDDAMATEMGSLSLADLVSIRRAMELLGDMLQAVGPNDSEAVKDEVIVDLIRQCRSNQNKIMHMISSTADEELLSLGLTLNDNLRSLIAKHDAIAYSLPLPTKETDSIPTASAPSALKSHSGDEIEEDEDDGFTQLARRNTTSNSVSSPTTAIGATDRGLSSSWSHIDSGNTAPSIAGAPTFVAGNELALPTFSSPITTASVGQDFNRLSITTTTASPKSIRSGHPVSVSPQREVYPYNPHAYPINQQYITPFTISHTSWPQKTSQRPTPQPQFQLPQDPPSYPPPPWEINDDDDDDDDDDSNLMSTTHQQPRQLHQYNSFDLGVSSSFAPTPLRQYHSFSSSSAPQQNLHGSSALNTVSAAHEILAHESSETTENSATGDHVVEVQIEPTIADGVTKRS